MLKVIIIDDEPLAIELLKSYVNKVPNVKLMEVFTDAVNASSYLKNYKVDLILLDINMPDINGVELAKSLKNPPMIVFTTAYSEFAVEGFNISALDYLLKPISFDRFLKAMEKAKNLFELRENAALHNDNFVLVKSDYQSLKINTDEILYVEGLDDYIKIYTKSNQVVTLQSLKLFLEQLPENDFARIHRSYIVNVNRITSFSKRHVMLGETELPIGSTYCSMFFDKIGYKE